jgi:hypothetical protein
MEVNFDSLKVDFKKKPNSVKIVFPLMKHLEMKGELKTKLLWTMKSAAKLRVTDMKMNGELGYRIS